MSKYVTTETISPEFLSKSDVEFISELVQDWQHENNSGIESFSFSIEVSWEDDGEG